MHATAVHVLPGMLRYLGVAEDDIDDLSQEVLLGAYTSLPRYNPAYPASAPGSASLPPAASPLLQHFVSAVPAAAEDAAQEQQEQDDPASLPPPAPGNPSRPSRPHGLGPRWRAECSWLFGIAWRKVRRHLERTYRRLEVPVGLADEAFFEGADVAPSSEQHIATNQRIAIATRLLATIAPDGAPFDHGRHGRDPGARDRASSEDQREHCIKSAAPRARRLPRRREAPAPRGAACAPLRPAHGPALLPHLLALRRRVAGRPLRRLRHRRDERARDPSRAAERARTPGPRKSTRARRSPRAPARPVHPPGAGVGDGRRRRRRAVCRARAGAGLWANRLGPIATPLLLSRAVDLDARPETGAGGRPRSEAPRADAISDKEAPPSRAPTPAPARVFRQHKPAAPEQHAPSDQDREPLADELQLLDAARQALLQGDRATALERIAAHERRFPEGRLKLTRERLRFEGRGGPGSAGRQRGGADASVTARTRPMRGKSHDEGAQEAGSTRSARLDGRGRDLGRRGRTGPGRARGHAAPGAARVHPWARRRGVPGRAAPARGDGPGDGRGRPL